MQSCNSFVFGTVAGSLVKWIILVSVIDFALLTEVMCFHADYFII